MQIKLTPKAEKLLHDAMAQSPGRSASEVVEQALAEKVTPKNGKGNSLKELLESLPSVKSPFHWPPRFKPIEALWLEGELPSERLVRERR